ncbi:hypothetical protein F6R97_25885 [Pseudomonas sp. JV414]|nr:hypothetical protein [Pseudomonas sp. JV414]
MCGSDRFPASNTEPVGAWLARDAGAAVSQIHRSAPIAGKPAPTEDCVEPSVTFDLSYSAT